MKKIKPVLDSKQQNLVQIMFWGKSKELSFHKMNEKAQPSGHISNMKWKQQKCQRMEDGLGWSEEQRKEMEE